jgi:hypothetical protein
MRMSMCRFTVRVGTVLYVFQFLPDFIRRYAWHQWRRAFPIPFGAIALLSLGLAAAGVVRFVAELADELAVFHRAAARQLNFLAGILAYHLRAKHRAYQQRSRE